MGWKQINGLRYYDKSERQGGRVKTTYFGACESGLLIAAFEAADREEKEEVRERRRAEREESALEEESIVDWFDGIQAEADATMFAAGFHNRRGQWPRRRK
jgi:hypothetical protein